MGKRHYRDLICWQRAIDLAPHIYQLVNTLPADERYALGDQLRRACVSIPANIAEGQARQRPKEFLQHLAIAKGSLAELHTLLLVCARLGYLSPDSLAACEHTLATISRPLHGLISTIRSQLAANSPARNPQPITRNQAPEPQVAPK